MSKESKTTYEESGTVTEEAASTGSTQSDEPTVVRSTTSDKVTFHFPDIEGGGPAVAIEATNMEEAQDLYRKQKGATAK